MRDLIRDGTTGVCLFVMVALLAAYGSVSAATLVLQDGAVIHGEIQTLQDDVYTVKTDSLGTVRVLKRNVRSIDHSDDSPPRSPVGSSPNGASPERAEVQSMQSRLMQNPDLFSLIETLKSDPEVLAVLADPEIMSAVAAGNYAALMNHPKIIALTRNAKVREVIDEAQ